MTVRNQRWRMECAFKLCGQSADVALGRVPIPSAATACPQTSRANQLKRKPGFGNERCTAPVRDQASRIGNEINAATWPRVRIPGKDKTIFLRQIGVVVAQIEVEDLVGEGHARLPIEIGR
jgi:hypothetical protein